MLFPFEGPLRHLDLFDPGITSLSPRARELAIGDVIQQLADEPAPCPWIGFNEIPASHANYVNEVVLGTGPHVHCFGKGRKHRCTPLRPDVAAVLKEWLEEQPSNPSAPLFPSSRGGRMSADALQRLVARHAANAARVCPSLLKKNVTPHTLRHSAAMGLTHRGVHLSVIALWLGHETTETAQIYIHADMRLKEQALAHATPSGMVPERYHPPDPLLRFLEEL